MEILTTFDDNFLAMAKAFFYSCRNYSMVPISATVSSRSSKSIQFCKDNKIRCTKIDPSTRNPKVLSRILKMQSADTVSNDVPVAYMDIDIVFQNDISSLEDLNPNYLWVLSKREGHQTNLRKWKKHYFRKSDVDFARKHLKTLAPEVDIEKALESPVRNCGVLYSNKQLLQRLFTHARAYYDKLLKLNKKSRAFSESDQLCFLLAFMHDDFRGKIRELPLRFNRMPYHQSYDFKDKSSFFVPDNVVLHLNKCKGLGSELVNSWAKNRRPNPKLEDNTRLGIVLPIQTSGIAERSLLKNLYSLAVSNKANIYRDEDVGFPIQKRIAKLDKIRDGVKKERPAYDRGLFFMINGFMFMIDHGEYTGNRAQWIIGKHVTSDQLAGIFIEQMDQGLDIKKSKIPIVPIAYGTKFPDLWFGQGDYHYDGLYAEKKYSVHFIGNIGTNRKKRERQVKILSKIPDSKIVHKTNSTRMSFEDYIKDLISAKIVWCPPGGRPKSHREIEAMCCEVAVMMAPQNIVEPEMLKPDHHYISIRDDCSDAVAKVEYYLSNPEELDLIAHNGRMWYERNASDYARAKHIYTNAIKIIGAIP